MTTKRDGQEKQQISTILSLAVLGLVFVLSLTFFSFVFDRAGDSDDTEGQLVIEKKIEKTYEFDSQGYGIRVEELLDWKVEPNILALTQENATAIDCRKMSATMRKNLTNRADACYEVELTNNDNESYLIITTGNDFYKDQNEIYILPDLTSEVREYPSSQLNLPLERIYVSDFPVNFIGTKVSYSSGSSYTYYKGIVYKGADKYALVVAGDMNNGIREILAQLELE